MYLSKDYDVIFLIFKNRQNKGINRHIVMMISRQIWQLCLQVRLEFDDNLNLRTRAKKKTASESHNLLYDIGMYCL